MKIVSISDTHLQHSYLQIPDGDILIHSGDFTSDGSIKELIKFNSWLGKLPHKHKVVVPGNHDRCVEQDINNAKALLTNAYLLVDEEINIEGLKIYGTPWTPTFGHWSFMLPRKGERVKQLMSQIPEGLDILITHGPPFSILDEVVEFVPNQCDWKKLNVGCEVLLSAVLDKKPKYHFFGHIHGGYGKYDGLFTKFVNASSCTEEYRPKNKPMVVEI